VTIGQQTFDNSQWFKLTYGAWSVVV